MNNFKMNYVTRKKAEVNTFEEVVDVVYGNDGTNLDKASETTLVSSQLVGKSYEGFVRDTNKKITNKIMEKAFAGNDYEYQEQLVFDNGTEKTVKMEVVEEQDLNPTLKGVAFVKAVVEYAKLHPDFEYWLFLKPLDKKKRLELIDFKSHYTVSTQNFIDKEFVACSRQKLDMEAE